MLLKKETYEKIRVNGLSEDSIKFLKDGVFEITDITVDPRSISEIDRYYNNRNTIIADKANILSKNWYLENVSIINNNGNKDNYKSLDI